jgi:hypothetical protein
VQLKTQSRAGKIQRSATNSGPVNVVPPVVHEVLNSSGQPLETDTREFMESRFGHDFSGVRVHTDSRAAESARAVNALAYTVGRNVVFDSGRYTPKTQEGQKLMAHELTHVVQQSGCHAGSGRLSLGKPGTSHEHEASTAAKHLETPTSNTNQSPKFRISKIHGSTIQRLGPVAAGLAAFGVGVAAGALTAEVALDYARSLSTRYPGWLSVLPNCPCRQTDVLASPSVWAPDANPLLGYFHPGAATSFRSTSAFASVPGSAHGQQCTYDSRGNLITSGPGAGTPDVWSPITNPGDHFSSDVITWQILGSRIYNSYWRPNNGNGCT